MHRLTVHAVPVDGFRSISAYNARGYFEPNEQGAYTVNKPHGEEGRGRLRHRFN